jgi:hypothetical protein
MSSRVTSPPPHWDVCLYVCKKHSFFNYHYCIEKYLHILSVHFFSLLNTATITTNAAVSIYAFWGHPGLIMLQAFIHSWVMRLILLSAYRDKV